MVSKIKRSFNFGKRGEKDQGGVYLLIQSILGEEGAVVKALEKKRFKVKEKRKDRLYGGGERLPPQGEKGRRISSLEGITRNI